MIELKDGTIEVRIIGQTNVVLTVTSEGSSTQLNMRKLKNKWEHNKKKGDLDWANVYCVNTGEYSKYRLDKDYARMLVVKYIIVPKLDEYLAQHYMEKILLH